MENYIVINGKKAELTEEQLEKLGIKIKKDNPFERLPNQDYLYVSYNGEVCEDTEGGYNADASRYRVANYCRDEALMQQRAYHETLDRLLWRFACENGELDNPWDGEHAHWNIVYDTSEKYFHPSCICYAKCNEPYFPSKELAQRAVDEIIIPFMKKHPGFVW